VSRLPEPLSRVVIGADAHAAYASALHGVRPDLEIRHSGVLNITDDDFTWGEVYVGFSKPPVSTMGNVRWVHCTGAGVDAWTAPGVLPEGVLLTRSSESYGPMIGEWALARALAFTQQLREVGQQQHEQRWERREVRDMRGTHAVVLGTGDVGTGVARLFRAMGCTVHGVSKSGGGDATVFHALSRAGALPTVVQRADWFLLMLPLTTETRGLVGREVLQHCRGAVLFNAGRGAVLQESVLPEALERGWLRGAALDVFETEPLPATSPLWRDPRVMISPHIAGLTTTAGAIAGFVECLVDIEHGHVPKWAVTGDRQY
jgi:phosphoglycerate dehydrogenase-like enzyme